ncbi:MAG: hypothetical protein MRQ07_01575 [Candidatus Midichloria sp.]|nr:hypothetical protein [Candidatus Midichloria sp.]
MATAKMILLLERGMLVQMVKVVRDKPMWYLVALSLAAHLSLKAQMAPMGLLLMDQYLG